MHTTSDLDDKKDRKGGEGKRRERKGSGHGIDSWRMVMHGGRGLTSKKHDFTQSSCFIFFFIFLSFSQSRVPFSLLAYLSTTTYHLCSRLEVGSLASQSCSGPYLLSFPFFSFALPCLASPILAKSGPVRSCPVRFRCSL